MRPVDGKAIRDVMKNLQPENTNNNKILDAFDAAMDCQENLMVLAILLEDSGNAAFDPHEKCVLSGAGRLVANEAKKLQFALDSLETHCQKRPTSQRHSKAGTPFRRPVTSKTGSRK